MAPVVLAGIAGLASGLSLVVGAAVAWFVTVPRWLVATIMAFGAGVLISALAFDLVEEATQTGSFTSAMAGFFTGAIVYVGLDILLERVGSRKKRARSKAASSGTGLGIALGSLLDGVPETAVQGLGLAATGSLSLAIVAAVIISNFPEGLSSTSDMKQNGKSAAYVFGIWGSIAVICTLSAIGGFALLGSAPESTTSFVTAIAAGAILAMIADTMLPEAFGTTKAFTGLIAVCGFFTGYALHVLGG
ncbi:ZIP family zinc transporter [Microbacterium halimionae]|uniref:ZIP family zinc transporter n=1 Tax=Microbacterium halimionae TaxID=1526413 RepID=A0A7W3JPY9_9MICO|nr:ZIP family zinc transporter [Microbacterium halimionae]MBA8816846.1 ZIP family zinc transporter [Microbacterium halimionae]NII94858.1 ZIP family zinc transporter [Microbacterium halimionae]